jgi:hypothetical protein
LIVFLKEFIMNSIVTRVGVLVMVMVVGFSLVGCATSGAIPNAPEVQIPIVVSAQTTTYARTKEEVARYVRENFDVEYKAPENDMTCKEGSPTPRNPNKVVVHFNCQESVKNGLYTVIGWRFYSMTRSDFHGGLAVLFKSMAKVGWYKKDDVINCTLESPEPSWQGRGDLYNCKAYFPSVQDKKFKNLSFSIFYFKRVQETGYDFYVLSDDDFQNKPEFPRAQVLRLQALMTDMLPVK